MFELDGWHIGHTILTLKIVQIVVGFIVLRTSVQIAQRPKDIWRYNNFLLGTETGGVVKVLVCMRGDLIVSKNDQADIVLLYEGLNIFGSADNFRSINA